MVREKKTFLPKTILKPRVTFNYVKVYNVKYRFNCRFGGKFGHFKVPNQPSYYALSLIEGNFRH